MNKSIIRYFEDDDVIHLILSDEDEAGSFDISPNITAELNEQGNLIGIEILRASEFIRDFIMESVQARMVNLSFRKGGL